MCYNESQETVKGSFRCAIADKASEFIAYSDRT